MPRKTESVPGTTNAEWQARKEAAMARGQGNIAPVYIDQGGTTWCVRA